MRGDAVHYSDGAPVMLGDSIRARVFLFPVRGTVIYITGQSEPLPDMEIPGMASFAIQLQSGRTMSWTRPFAARLEQHFRLLSR